MLNHTECVPCNLIFSICRLSSRFMNNRHFPLNWFRSVIFSHLSRMFETRNDVKVMFEQFRSVEKADLGASRALENHALLVMNALDEAIANMDDPDYLIDMLLVTGKSHRRFEHFSADIFWVSLVVLGPRVYVTRRLSLCNVHARSIKDKDNWIFESGASWNLVIGKNTSLCLRL